MTGRADQTKVGDPKLAWYYNFYKSIKEAPINLTLLLVSAFVFYKVVTITRNHRKKNNSKEIEIEFPPIKNELPSIHRDFTVKQLREFDGTRDDGRILLAVNLNVYDVSSAVHFYGRDGAYPHYAGSDISRDLINIGKNKRDEYDDLSDLTAEQMNALLKWDKQYCEKYPLVGVLVPDFEQEISNFIRDDEYADINLKPKI